VENTHVITVENLINIDAYEQILFIVWEFCRKGENILLIIRPGSSGDIIQITYLYY
ncbi:MAG: hypothetical protein ACI90V_013105, partial [Bacillariaceae sp.]|jgi:hypothetical protein